MKWSLNELKKFQNQVIDFTDKINLKSEILSRNSEVLDLSEVTIVGTITVNRFDYILSYEAAYQIVLPSTRSLEPVKINEVLKVDEVFMTEIQYQQSEVTENEEIFILEKDLIDLKESLADNILLNIPIQVLTAEEQEGAGFISGNNWEVLSEEEYLKRSIEEKKENNSPFSNLNQLFSEKDE